jgi:hypothetical protein
MPGNGTATSIGCSRPTLFRGSRSARPEPTVVNSPPTDAPPGSFFVTRCVDRSLAVRWSRRDLRVHPVALARRLGLGELRHLSRRWSCENSASGCSSRPDQTNRPAAILYSDSLQRHASFYWPEGETNPEPKSETECDQFRSIVESGRLVLSTNANLCGLSGTKVASFKRDARIHDKHHIEFIFEFGKSDASRVETPAGNN